MRLPNGELRTRMDLICGLRPAAGPLAAAIGNFDGVHLGHRHVLDQLRAAAKPRGLACAVITFEPHPLELLRPADAPPRIDELHAKARKLAAAGVDAMIIARFRRTLAQLSPAQFADLLADRLQVRLIAVGADFRFGKDRSGDADELQRCAAGRFEVSVAQDLQRSGRRISSGLVRELLAVGDFAAAAGLLGEDYEIAGRVVAGAGMGKGLGVPTANLRRRHRPPLDGVYAARASIDGGELVPAALSVGTRAAAGGSELAIEAHLLDFSGNVYGRRMRIRPVRLLREQRNYPDLASLKRAMEEDLAACRSVLGEG